MRDALPTIHDIRKIYFKQQRKKNLIPQHANLTNSHNMEIYNFRKELMAMGASRVSDEDMNKLDSLIKAKSDAEDIHFEEIRKNLIDHIISHPQTIRLSKVWHEDRDIYSINKRRLIPTLLDRYVSLIIARSFKVRSMGRDQAVRVLMDALRVAKGGSAAYRTIIKFDVENFFESLHHEQIKRKLSSHSGIPRFALKHIDSVITALKRIDKDAAHLNRGVPQGVPSSSVLAEIYLENLDNKIKQDSSVILYLRYVDDIIIICDESNSKHVTTLVESELDSLGLAVNVSKKYELNHPTQKLSSFEYLGYKFVFSEKESQLEHIDISDAKLRRYSQAIKQIEDFTKKSPCWADEERVDTFIGLVEYLLFPHATDEDVDTPRIVTGLAFSAKFVTKQKRSNFNDIIRETKSVYFKNTGSFINIVQLGNNCGCCKMPIHRESDLRKYSKLLNHDGLMFSPALSHLDDKTRERIRRILWK